MKIKLVGMTFSVREFPELKTNNPSGDIKFVRNTQFDKDSNPEHRGIMVMKDNVRIGWVKNISPEQTILNAVLDTTGAVVGWITECDYASAKPWCEVGFEVIDELHEDEPPEEDKNFEFYKKNGLEYKRASTILDYVDADGARGIEGSLTRWMIETFTTHAEYVQYMKECGDSGTDGHSAVEEACKAGIIDAYNSEGVEDIIRGMDEKLFNRIPASFWNFVQKECAGLKCIGTEETVYDDEILVAGTYDALFKAEDGRTILVDWKTSKSLRLDHIIKTCFYAELKDADEAWVVILNSKNKSGYQLKKIGPMSIANGYQLMKWAAVSEGFAQDLKRSLKEGL